MAANNTVVVVGGPKTVDRGRCWGSRKTKKIFKKMFPLGLTPRDRSVRENLFEDFLVFWVPESPGPGILPAMPFQKKSDFFFNFFSRCALQAARMAPQNKGFLTARSKQLFSIAFGLGSRD